MSYASQVICSYKIYSDLTLATKYSFLEIKIKDFTSSKVKIITGASPLTAMNKTEARVGGSYIFPLLVDSQTNFIYIITIPDAQTRTPYKLEFSYNIVSNETNSQSSSSGSSNSTTSNSSSNVTEGTELAAMVGLDLENWQMIIIAIGALLFLIIITCVCVKFVFKCCNKKNSAWEKDQNFNSPDKKN